VNANITVIDSNGVYAIIDDGDKSHGGFPRYAVSGERDS
jgi:hypothetical protein